MAKVAKGGRVTLRAITLLTAWAVVASTVPSAMAQIEPEAPIGSLIKRKPKVVDPERAGASVKAFARCTYGRKKDVVPRLLANSDPMAIDMSKADFAKSFGGTKLLMEDCLGWEANVDTAALELSISPERLRVLLMEEDYLARNPSPPKIDAAAPPPIRTFVATGDDLVRAQAIARFSDCFVSQDTAGADSLLRMQPGRDEERAAARALAPVLGSCLLEGEQLKLTPTLVRVYATEGLWARFARRTDKMAEVSQ